MRGELRSVLKASVAAYPGVPRDKWLFEWPSQVILVVNQIFWCQEVEQVRKGDRVRASLSCRCPPNEPLRARQCNPSQPLP